MKIGKIEFKQNGIVCVSCILLIVCIDIEYKILLFPCNSNQIAKATNNIILALSYSYIAAVFFHYFVNYRPFKVRQEAMTPLIIYKLLQTREYIRQSKNVVINPYSFQTHEYVKEEYIKHFNNCDLFEKTFFGENKTKLRKINELKNNISINIDVLLSYNEYLTDSQFTLVNDIASSIFLQNEIIPNNAECNEDMKNQDVIGESIFDLYEKTKALPSV